MAKKEYTEEEKEIIQSNAKTIVIRYLRNSSFNKHCASSLSDSKEHFTFKVKRSLMGKLLRKEDEGLNYDIKLSFEYACQLFYRDSVRLYIKYLNMYEKKHNAELSKDVAGYIKILNNFYELMENAYHNKKDNSNVDRAVRNLFALIKETVELEEVNKIVTPTEIMPIPAYFVVKKVIYPYNQLQYHILRDYKVALDEALK